MSTQVLQELCVNVRRRAANPLAIDAVRPFGSVRPVGRLSGLALADNGISVFGVSASGEVLRYFWRPDAWYFENLTLAVTGCTMSDPHNPAQTTRVSVASDGNQGNEGSYNSVLSADGRYVAFLPRATNLVPGDTNSWGDVFVRGPLAPCTQ